ncbi:MAG: PEP-CTERM sorting domain-containing protein [Planctomycetota bacterium]|jgi:hypothetical protein
MKRRVICAHKQTPTIFTLVAFVAMPCLMGTASSASAQNVMDFEGPAIGTRYGASAGDLPGDVVLVEDGIQMSVENFTSMSGDFFFDATVGGDYQGFFPTTPLSLNNIDTRFDFTGLPLDTALVRLEFREFAGTVDFAINDGPKYVLADMVDLPTDLGNGINAVVGISPQYSSIFVITITGDDINSIQLGGQEFALDRITAHPVPEPTTLILLAAGGLAMVRRRR